MNTHLQQFFSNINILQHRYDFIDSSHINNLKNKQNMLSETEQLSLSVEENERFKNTPPHVTDM